MPAATPTAFHNLGTLALTTGYCLMIVLASLAGGWLPRLIRLTHTRVQMMMSFVGGLMLGIGLFHMLPHAHAELGSLDRTVWWMMLGLLCMFFLIRLLHFHQHGPMERDDVPEPAMDLEQAGEAGLKPPVAAGESGRRQRPVGNAGHQHAQHDAHRCEHTHGQADSHDFAAAHKLSWLGVFLGLAVHTFIDGLALGASIQAEAGGGAFLSLFGLGTFLAILLHKPLDAVSITSLMAAAGWSIGWRNLVNAGFALMCPLGAGMFFLGVGYFASEQQVVVGCALAFSAGVFLCISLGDLLPEMEFHSHNRAPLSVLLLTGILLAYGIGYLEPGHAHHHHGHANDSAESVHGLHNEAAPTTESQGHDGERNHSH